MRSGALITALVVAIMAALAAPTGALALQFPPNLGRVVYAWNEKSPRIIYVIGVSHRDALTMGNGPETVKAQTEVYRIGQYLAGSGVQLLLPEGFFMANGVSADAAATPIRAVLTGAAAQTPTARPAAQLKEMFSASSRYVNAEMLLEKDLGFTLAQVEDPDLYQKELGLLKQAGQGDYFTMLNLQYLQLMRTARMLQQAPEVTDKEYSESLIKTKDAMMTMGLAHLKELIGFLNKGGINIEAPLFAPADYRDYSAGLNAAKLGYGIVVIIPESLASNQAILELTGLASR